MARQTAVITNRGNVGEIYRSIGRIGWWSASGYFDEDGTLNLVEEKLRSDWLRERRKRAYQCALEIVKKIQTDLGVVSVPDEVIDSEQGQRSRNIYCPVKQRF